MAVVVRKIITGCSSGNRARMASISELLPTADELCTSTASGASSSRDTAAR
jgi:hypothetical protein